MTQNPNEIETIDAEVVEPADDAVRERWVMLLRTVYRDSISVKEYWTVYDSIPTATSKNDLISKYVNSTYNDGTREAFAVRIRLPPPPPPSNDEDD